MQPRQTGRSVGPTRRARSLITYSWIFSKKQSQAQSSSPDAKVQYLRRQGALSQPQVSLQPLQRQKRLELDFPYISSSTIGFSFYTHKQYCFLSCTCHTGDWPVSQSLSGAAAWMQSIGEMYLFQMHPFLNPTRRNFWQKYVC